LRASRLILSLALVGAIFTSACSPDDPASAAGGEAASASTLRLGYFPNLTHATAIVGVDEGLFEDALGDVGLEPAIFNSGTEAVEALFSDAIDASFVGPNPAINAWQQSDGAAIRIVSGATSGGALLVVRDGIDSVEDLAGKTLSTPDLGNTQDVALRAWLKDEGYETDLEGGGDVSILPQDNSAILETFQAGEIDGAWVPEPYATRMILEGSGHVLVDERDLWPEGRFVTTHLIVASKFLEENPDAVRDLLSGVVEANSFVNENPEEAKQVVNDGIEAITGSPISPKTLDQAWDNLLFTLDPIASSLERSADAAVEVGLLEPVDLEGIYDLSLLNEALTDAGLPEISE
jgi:NitT/TauT family transport system substrate-binding protein